MTKWAKAQGKMVSGHIESGESYDQSSSSYQTYYQPVVTYQYEVNGVEYTGTRVTQGAFQYGSSGDVQKFLADHPIGSPITVYYDPANPADSILEKGLGSMATKQLALAGGVFAGIGGLAIIFVGLLLLLICVVTVVVLWALGMGLNTFSPFGAF
jgi:hypothetical protein